MVLLSSPVAGFCSALKLYRLRPNFHTHASLVCPAADWLLFLLLLLPLALARRLLIALRINRRIVQHTYRLLMVL
jgi:hypothetical protein